MDFPQMLTLAGQVTNAFHTPKRINKQGEPYGGDPAIQLLCRVPVDDGESKLELVTLKTDALEAFAPYRGRWVRVAVGMWARDGGSGLYAIKGALPEPIDVAA